MLVKKLIFTKHSKKNVDNQILISFCFRVNILGVSRW